VSGKLLSNREIQDLLGSDTFKSYKEELGSVRDTHSKYIGFVVGVP
jgi:hypothetical protein